MLTENLIVKHFRDLNSRYTKLDSVDKFTIPQHDTAKPMILYIHIPFCEELCPYCSFNRVVYEDALAMEYFDALKREILLYKNLGFNFQSVYIGGGTPTIHIDKLAEIIKLVRDNFNITEISCETNPNHLTDKHIKILKESHIDRLSVGVQSLDDKILKEMHRYEKYGSGDDIQKRLRDINGEFKTLNADLIFNFPGQNKDTLKRDCEIITSLDIDQVTFYPLMVSKSINKLMKRRFENFSFLSEKIYYYHIRRHIEKKYKPNTAWCFSKANGMVDEYIINYDEYVGVGSGSFGYYGGMLVSNTFSIKEYIDRLNNGVSPVSFTRKFTIVEQIRYDFLMKLFGIRVARSYINTKYGELFYNNLKKEIAFLKFINALKVDENEMRLTKKGQYYWVVMMREFFIGVNNFRDYCRNLIKN